MVTSLFWRPLPVLTLTVRQFVGGKAVRVVTVLSFIPCVFSLIYLLNTDVSSSREFVIDIIREFVIPTLLPITILILATGALGNEVEDRTLPYLTLKPFGRLRIIVEKLGGILVIALPIVTAGLVASALIALRGDTGDNLRLLGAIAAASAAGAFAYGALFLMISLIIPRALLVGIIYSFVWESLLGRFLAGIRVVSIRHFVESIFVGVLDDRFITIDDPTSLRAATITLILVGLVSVALATWRLRRMNLE